MLERPDRPLRLARWPLRQDDPLRAWDAADEYLLHHLDAHPPPAGARVLLINDAFGALACALHRHRPAVWSDSHLARLALAHNLAENGLAEDAAAFTPGEAEPPGPVDLAVMKIPKSLDLFADQLRLLRPRLAPGSTVVCGSMIKHTPGRAYALLGERIGATSTGLAVKKSRLAFSLADAAPVAAAAEPGYALPEHGLTLSAPPGVFAAARLDLGTRLLLAHLPRTDVPLRACDLGCGNGALGLALARRCPAASVLLVDESYRAVAGARRNAAANGLADRDLEFRTADGLRDQPESSLDLILCNPPFHQAHAVDDLAAWRMFDQAARTLRPGGELLVVGNRHLGYHVKLARLFGGCEAVGGDRKFVVLRAEKK